MDPSHYDLGDAKQYNSKTRSSTITSKKGLSDIQSLELANGIKDSLVNAGFTTADSILSSSKTEISKLLGIDLYVAQTIMEEAQRITVTSTDKSIAVSKNNSD
jgi:hypothetical protein